MVLRETVKGRVRIAERVAETSFTAKELLDMDSRTFSDTWKQKDGGTYKPASLDGQRRLIKQVKDNENQVKDAMEQRSRAVDDIYSDTRTEFISEPEPPSLPEPEPDIETESERDERISDEQDDWERQRDDDEAEWERILQEEEDDWERELELDETFDDELDFDDTKCRAYRVWMYKNVSLNKSDSNREMESKILNQSPQFAGIPRYDRRLMMNSLRRFL